MGALRGNSDSTAEFIPHGRGLTTLRRAAADCRGCGLWRDATQTVFGTGPRDADLMLVGEQPGDLEDRVGEPFVGPAGSLLERALDEAEISRGDVYLTNAVKHFKWHRASGKRRLHDKPSVGEANACQPWLLAEVEMVKPNLILALGATAARSLFGASIRVTRDRGKAVESRFSATGMVTIHPSALLRIQGTEEREQSFSEFVDDLQRARAGSRKGNDQRMAKDHGPSVKNDKQYEGLRKKGMSKQRAASIANSSEASKKGGEKRGKGSGGSKSQKRAAGREGGKKSAKKSS
jgi:uracil-DNA glycosylase family protein